MPDGDDQQPTGTSVWKQERGPITAAMIVVTLAGSLIAAWRMGTFEAFGSADPDLFGSLTAVLDPLPLWLLAAYRTIVAIAGAAIIVQIIRQEWRPPFFSHHTASRRQEPITILGLERLTTFTSWSFMLLIAVFAGAATSAWLAYFGQTPPTQLSSLTTLLFPVAYACALLVTIVVSFVLIPGSRKHSFPNSDWFSAREIAMHDLNVVVLAFELIIGGIAIDSRALPLAVLFGLSYVLFAAAYERHKGIFHYDFLDPRPAAAPLWHLGLLLAILTLFGVVAAVDAALSRWPLPATIALLIGTASILRLSPPDDGQTRVWDPEADYGIEAE